MLVRDHFVVVQDFLRLGLQAVLLWGLCSFAGAVTVTVPNPPATVQPGQPVTVSVSFSKPSSIAEKRLVLILELKRLSDDAVLAKTVSDNGGQGYTNASSSVPMTLTVPAGTSGQLYFAAYASPWSLNRSIVQRYKSYPTDGTFTYLWGGGGYGVTQNVSYLGNIICPKPSGNTTYCSGLAFETCILGYQDYNTAYGHSTIGNLTVTQMQDFRRVWYGVTDAEKLAARAIPEYGLGLEITNLEEAQEGDSVQFWRHSGSGHNPVFVNWIRNGSGQITGLRYWGSQSSSNGIGYRTEYFGTSSGINPARFYLGRLRKPRDQADYDWALGSTTTQAQPTIVPVSSVGDWDRYD